MKRRHWKNEIRNAIKYLVFALTSLLFSTMSSKIWLLLGREPRVLVQSTLNISDPFTKRVISSFRNSFTSYYSRCKGHDELRPEAASCVDEFGFSSTMFESLETMAILNQNDLFDTTRKYVKSFSCRSLGWVRRRDLFDMCISSLIGTYILTKDKTFLEKASECSLDVIEFDRILNFSYPLINLRDMNGKANRWEGGSALEDKISGYSEYSFLYNLTKDIRFSAEAKRILGSIPDPWPKSSILPDGDSGVPEDGPIDQFNVNFLIDIASVEAVFPSEKAGLIIRHFFSTPVPEKPYLTALLDLDKQVCIPNCRNLKEIEEKLMNEPEFSVFNQGDSANLRGFIFDGAGLRLTLRESRPKAYYEALFDEMVRKCELSTGYSGMKVSSFGHITHNDIQHSSLFGQWMSGFALFVSGLSPLLNSSIVNRFGHILYLR